MSELVQAIYIIPIIIIIQLHLPNILIEQIELFNYIIANTFCDKLSNNI